MRYTPIERDISLKLIAGEKSYLIDAACKDGEVLV